MTVQPTATMSAIALPTVYRLGPFPLLVRSLWLLYMQRFVVDYPNLRGFLSLLNIFEVYLCTRGQ